MLSMMDLVIMRRALMNTVFLHAVARRFGDERQHRQIFSFDVPRASL